MGRVSMLKTIFSDNQSGTCDSKELLNTCSSPGPQPIPLSFLPDKSRILQSQPKLGTIARLLDWGTLGKIPQQTQP